MNRTITEIENPLTNGCPDADRIIFVIYPPRFKDDRAGIYIVRPLHLIHLNRKKVNDRHTVEGAVTGGCIRRDRKEIEESVRVILGIRIGIRL